MKLKTPASRNLSENIINLRNRLIETRSEARSITDSVNLSQLGLDPSGVFTIISRYCNNIDSDLHIKYVKENGFPPTLTTEIAGVDFLTFPETILEYDNETRKGGFKLNLLNSHDWIRRQYNDGSVTFPTRDIGSNGSVTEVGIAEQFHYSRKNKYILEVIEFTCAYSYRGSIGCNNTNGTAIYINNERKYVIPPSNGLIQPLSVAFPPKSKISMVWYGEVVNNIAYYSYIHIPQGIVEYTEIPANEILQTDITVQALTNVYADSIVVNDFIRIGSGSSVAPIGSIRYLLNQLQIKVNPTKWDDIWYGPSNTQTTDNNTVTVSTTLVSLSEANVSSNNITSNSININNGGDTLILNPGTINLSDSLLITRNKITMTNMNGIEMIDDNLEFQLCSTDNTVLSYITPTSNISLTENKLHIENTSGLLESGIDGILITNNIDETNITKGAISLKNGSNGLELTTSNIVLNNDGNITTINQDGDIELYNTTNIKRTTITNDDIRISNGDTSVIINDDEIILSSMQNDINLSIMRDMININELHRNVKIDTNEIIVKDTNADTTTTIEAAKTTTPHLSSARITLDDRVGQLELYNNSGQAHVKYSTNDEVQYDVNLLNGIHGLNRIVGAAINVSDINADSVRTADIIVNQINRNLYTDYSFISNYTSTQLNNGDVFNSISSNGLIAVVGSTLLNTGNAELINLSNLRNIISIPIISNYTLTSAKIHKDKVIVYYRANILENSVYQHRIVIYNIIYENDIIESIEENKTITISIISQHIKSYSMNDTNLSISYDNTVYVYNIMNGDKIYEISESNSDINYATTISMSITKLFIGSFDTIAKRGYVDIYTILHNNVVNISNDDIYIEDNLSINMNMCVSSSGNHIVLTTYGLNSLGFIKTFTYESDNWTVNNINETGINTGDGFGSSVSCNNDMSTIVVGAPYTTNPDDRIINFINSGYVKVLQKTNDIYQSSTIFGSYEGQEFGDSVSVSGDVLVILVGSSSARINTNGEIGGQISIYGNVISKINCNEIRTSSLTIGDININNNTINGGTVECDSINTTGTISGGAITGTTINATSITGTTVTAISLYSGDIECNSLSTGTGPISGGAVTGTSLSAGTTGTIIIPTSSTTTNATIFQQSNRLQHRSNDVNNEVAYSTDTNIAQSVISANTFGNSERLVNTASGGGRGLVMTSATLTASELGLGTRTITTSGAINGGALTCTRISTSGSYNTSVDNRITAGSIRLQSGTTTTASTAGTVWAGFYNIITNNDTTGGQTVIDSNRHIYSRDINVNDSTSNTRCYINSTAGFMWLRQNITITGANTYASSEAPQTQREQFPLRITRVGTEYTDSNSYGYLNSVGNTGFTGSNTNNKRYYSAYFQGRLLTAEVNVHSDARIKTNVVSIDTGECLETFRRLQPKQYNYIDTVSRPTKKVYGFIAQEVKDILPHAVDNVGAEYIPDYYDIITEWNVCSYDDRTSLRIKLGKPYEISIGDKVRMILLINGAEQEEDMEVTVIDNEMLELYREGRDYTNLTMIFMYGKEVKDFHYLCKNTIWTLTTSVVLILDRQQQEHERRLNEYERRLQELEEKLNRLL